MVLKHGPNKLSEVNEVTLHFTRDQDRRIGERIELHFHSWAEYVVMYGDKATHERNLQAILTMAESVYREVRPYFGWMDEESCAWDASYDLLLDGHFPLGNEFVFIGRGLIAQANLADLERLGHWNTRLDDGGIAIRWAAKDRWERP